MTTWINTLTVALESDMPQEDAEQLMAAIAQLRGVIGVMPTESSPDDWAAIQRARHQLRMRVIAAFDE